MDLVLNKGAVTNRVYVKGHRGRGADGNRRAETERWMRLGDQKGACLLRAGRIEDPAYWRPLHCCPSVAYFGYHTSFGIPLRGPRVYIADQCGSYQPGLAALVYVEERPDDYAEVPGSNLGWPR
jgi:hypothetical protein